MKIAKHLLFSVNCEKKVNCNNVGVGYAMEKMWKITLPNKGFEPAAIGMAGKAATNCAKPSKLQGHF